MALPTPIRILHVDDDPEFGDLVKTFLEREDDSFDIITETSVVDARVHLEESTIDCIVSDYDMPDTDGLEFLRKVRRHDADLPFILFTGKGSEEIAAEAISAGVDDYQTKSGSSETYDLLANRIRNLVEQYHTRKQNQQQQERLSRVQEIGDLGYFDWHIDTGELFLSDQSYDLLGIHPDSFEHIHEAWLEIVHPADRETVETAIENALDGRGSYNIEFRITTPAGETRYVHEEAEVEFDKDGSPIRMTGAGFDITEQKHLQQERQESLHTLQRLYAISSDRTLDFETKVEELLTVGTEYLGLANGFLTRIDGETQHIESAVAVHPELQPGASCPLDEAYCKRTIEMDKLLTVVNAADEGWVDDAAYERFELGTYIGGLIQVGDSLYGTVCFADTDPRERPFTDSERVFVELLTRWVSYELAVREFETIRNQT